MKLGSSRIVFLIGRYAIKFAYSINGMMQNKNEGFIWSKYHHENLCPIIFGNRFFVVMKRASPSTQLPPISKINRLLSDIPELIINGHHDIGQPSNWGLIGKKDVFFDYGLNQIIKDCYYPDK